MKSVLFALLIFMPLAAFGTDFGNPLAAKLEAERRGSHVEMVGGNQASEASAFLSAVSVPVDDNDKWSISIVSSKSCPPCERLKQDFKTSKYLQAWVDVTNPQESFTHFTTYYVEDQLQGWRFQNVKFRTYPTLVINPPKNGRCGPPSDYLLIEGYNGDHKTLANVIRSEMKQYCYQHNVNARGQGYTKSGNRWIPPSNPPEAVASSLEPNGEDGRFFQEAGPTNGLAADPIGTMLLLLSVIPGGLTTVVAMIFGIWLLIRVRREKAGKKVLLSDDQFSALVNEVKKDAAILSGNIGSGITIAQSSTPSAASGPVASAS